MTKFFITNSFIAKYFYIHPFILLFFILFTFAPAQAYSQDNVKKAKVAEYERLMTENEKKGNKREVASYLEKIGLLYSEGNAPDAALKYFKKSLTIYEKIKDAEGIAKSQINIAKAYNGLSKYGKAIKALEGALDKAATIHNEEIMRQCYQLLANNYGKIGDKKKEHENITKFQAYDKHRENQELKKAQEQKDLELEQTKLKALEIEKQHKENEKELKKVSQSLTKAEEVNKEREMQIVLLSKEKELINKERELQNISLREQKARLEKETLFKNSVLGGLLLTGILAVVLFYGYREKKKSGELIKDQNAKIMGSINYAQRIQEAMLPKEAELRKLTTDAFIFFQPRERVSGDFYWFSGNNTGAAAQYKAEEFKNKEVIIAAVDCTGHGVPGAFMSMIGYNQLNNIIARGITDAGLILNELHQGVRSSLNQDTTNNQDGMDMALCVIKKDKKVVEFAGAKNPMVYISKGELVEVKGDKQGIGGSEKEGVRNFSKHTITLDAPTTFYIFSDGFGDQFGGAENKKFMSRNLKQLFLQIHEKSMEEQREILSQTLEKWKGKNNQTDDVLIIGFKI